MTIESETLQVELRKLELEAETRKEESRQGFRKVLYGTMVVGLAVAFFPFAQKLAESIFAERLAAIQTDADTDKFTKQTLLEEGRDEKKHQLDLTEQQFISKESERHFFESLAKETRSTDLVKRISVAEFYSYLDEPKEKRDQWGLFRDHLYKLQERITKERQELLAQAADPTKTQAQNSTIQSRLNELERLEDPGKINSPVATRTLLPTPSNIYEIDHVSRRILELAIQEYNADTNKFVSSSRKNKYFVNLLSHFPQEPSDLVSWNGVFISWLILEAGNPLGIFLSMKGKDLWYSALENNSTFLPGEQEPLPGDIAVMVALRSSRSVDVAKIGAGERQEFKSKLSVVYSVFDESVNAIAGDVDDSVEIVGFKKKDARLIGYIRFDNP